MKQRSVATLLIALLLAISLFGCQWTAVPSDTETTEVTGTDTSPADTETADTTGTETGGSTDVETEPGGGASPIPPCTAATHTDADDNDLCDTCGVTVVVVLDFYAINDLHGKIRDTSSQPGVDELTTYLKNAQKTDDYTVFLSSGDMWQGSSESNLTYGMAVTEWMNDLNFASMTLGNHEYDWGAEYIKQNAALAEFPFLAINIYDRATQSRADYCQPSAMVDLGSVQIGIIGAMGDCYTSISGDKVADVYFKTGYELTNLVKAESTRLREAGADIIVYSIHDGYGSSRGGTGSISASQLAGYYDASLSDGYVDLVFEGHTHQNYTLIDPHGVYHLQNGGDNKGISHAETKVNVANGHILVTEAAFVPTSTYTNLPDDPIINDLMEKYKDLVSKGEEHVGRNAAYRSSDELRSLVAKLYYQTAMEAWGEDYDIVLGGGFISVRSPYNLAVGDVSYATLQSLLPFDNTLVLCSVKGKDLQSKFFRSSNRNYKIYYEEYGTGVRDNLDPNGTYYVVVDTFTSSYAPNNLTVVETYTADVYARDLLADYIRAGGLS